MTKTILRLPQGFELLPQVRATLEDLLHEKDAKGKYKIIYYTKDIDLHEQYSQRIVSFTKAFYFIMETLPSLRIKSEEIDDYVKLALEREGLFSSVEAVLKICKDWPISMVYGHDLELMVAIGEIKSGVIYIDINQNDLSSFKYKVRDPDGKVQTGEILLQSLVNFKPGTPLTLENLQLVRQDILQITAKRGHTLLIGDCFSRNKELNAKDYAKKLDKFLGSLATFLKNYIYIPGFTEKSNETEHLDAAKACLNGAEVLIIMAQGRDDTATLSNYTAPQGTVHEFQWDRCLASCTEETYAELASIKQNDSLLWTPDWFRQLPFHLQFYLHGSDAFLTSNDLLFTDIKDFIITWANITTPLDKAFLRKQLSYIEYGQESDCFSSLKPDHQKLLRILVEGLTEEVISLENIEEKIKELNEVPYSYNIQLDELKRIRQLPFWFWFLEENKQRMIRKVLALKSDVKELCFSLPTRERAGIPGLPNVREHIKIILSLSGEILSVGSPSVGAAHPIPRDFIKSEKSASKDLMKVSKDLSWNSKDLSDASKDLMNGCINLALLYGRRNLQRMVEIAEGKPILLQTLITPVYIPKRAEFLVELPDYHLNQLLKKVIAEAKGKDDIVIEWARHPLNCRAKLVRLYTYAEDCAGIIQKAESQLKEIQKQLVVGVSPLMRESLAATGLRLHNLLEAYKALANSGMGTGIRDGNGREIFLSSQEHGIGHLLGWVNIITCVSGKDRTLSDQLHKDALQSYAAFYQEKLPGCYEGGEERKNFVDILAHLATTGHGECLASQLAPGSFGIQTLDVYLKKDVIEAIKQAVDDPERIEKETALAIINEAKKASKKGKDEHFLYIMATLKLPAPIRNSLMNELKFFIGEIPFWRDQVAYQYMKKLNIVNPIDIPTGVFIAKEIVDRLPPNGRNQENILVERLAEIYEGLLAHVKENKSENGEQTSYLKSYVAFFTGAKPIRTNVTKEFYDWVLNFFMAENLNSIMGEQEARLQNLKSAIAEFNRTNRFSLEQGSSSPRETQTGFSSYSS